MQDRPDKTTLLAAVATFLAEDVAGAVTDPGLAFRVKVAAHVLGGLAREVATEEVADDAELRALLGALGEEGTPPTGAEARRTGIAAARRRLATRLRDEPLEPERAAALLETLRALAGARARVGQPRFDLSDDPEHPVRR